VNKFTGYQKFVIGVLAFLQFTIILDFMIISPMGALLMPALHITPAQFGTVVSAYAFSAGISGLLAAGFADHFDRKKLLLFFYSGFIVGTLLCGLATNYEFLLMARMVTGLFGGVIGSIVLAIATDLFSYEMRGRVMGVVQTAFAASQVLGIPAGLYFSNIWGWHAPFLMIVCFGLIVGVVIFMKLQPIDGHLKLQLAKQNPMAHIYTTVTNRDYSLAFCVTGLLSTGGFLLMPFGSDFTVHNIGISLEDLPLVYLITGLATLFVGPIVGRLSDRFGKYRLFVCGSILSIVMVIIYTHLGRTPLLELVLVNILLFAGVFSRMIPSQAMMSAIPSPATRGSFMAVSSSLQQIAGGFAAMLAGLIVVRQVDGSLLHFEQLGYVLIGTSLTTVCMMYFIAQKVSKKNEVSV
jgi:predicted MFS family arabinose efflux permease